MAYLGLIGGLIIDPTSEIVGAVGDLWIHKGRIADPPGETVEEIRTIDCRGRVVMPGGIDMHSHIVGPKVNAARQLIPRTTGPTETIAVSAESRFRSDEIVPTIYEVAAKYLAMGYTTVFDAAIAPSASRLVHRELEQMAGLDTGFFALLGNHEYVLENARRDPRAVRYFLAWMLRRCGAWAPKLANPGGVAVWKQRAQGNVRDLHETISGFDATPADVILTLARAANELKLPHPLHVHGLNLGVPGNWQTTLETMKLLDGLRSHLAHVQFHSYGGAGDHAENYSSHVEPLAEWVNAHPELSVDVGQVMFGKTMTMTADAPLGYALSQLTGNAWFSHDIEVETGCGISPIEYKNKVSVHAWQWTIGLEWLLRVRNPWQIAVTTDHPNGGSFLSYPRIIRLLMDRDYRRAEFQRLPRKVRDQSPLRELDREYTLAEIAIVTRSGPARLLGIAHKGSLAPGCDADVTVYSPEANRETMFQFPWLVIKDGQVVVEGGEFRALSRGKTMAVAPSVDDGWEESFKPWFADHYSFRIEHFGRSDEAAMAFDRPLWRFEIAQ